MSYSDDYKSLLDPRIKKGTVANSLIESVAEKILDHIKSIIQTAQDLKNPLKTSKPEDLRARYNIEQPLTGAALEARITKERNIGDINYVASAIDTYLSSVYTFGAPPPNTVVYPHEDLSDSRFDDWRSFSIKLPAEDNVGVTVDLSDAGLIAEIDRVAPKWKYTLGNDDFLRTPNYIKKIASDHTGHNWQTVDVIPEDIRNITASSEYLELVSIDVDDVEWVEGAHRLRLADNVIDGEEVSHIDDVGNSIRIQSSNTHINHFKTISKEIVVPTDLLGGFEPLTPVIGGVGVTAVTARERAVSTTYDLTDPKINLNTEPSVRMLDPVTYIPYQIVQEQRFVDNDKKESDILVGTFRIFHQYLSGENSVETSLAGKEVRVYLSPIQGGADDRELLVANTHLIHEEYIEAASATDDKLPSGTEAWIKFGVEFIDEPSNREIDKTPKLISADEEMSCSFSVGGISHISMQSAMPLGYASPGLHFVQIRAGYDPLGLSDRTNMPPISNWNPAKHYMNIKKMHVEPGQVTVKFRQLTGTGGTTYTSSMVPIQQNAEFAMHDSAGECKSFSITAPDFFKLLNFGPGADPETVKLAWWVTFEMSAMGDVYELQVPGETQDPDIQHLEMSPDRVARVENIEIRKLGSAIQGLTPILLRDVLAEFKDLDDYTSIIQPYDANKIPEGGVWAEGWAKYVADDEDDSASFSVSIPVPTGYKCESIDIYWPGYSKRTVSINDTNQIRMWTGAMYKTVRLDTIIDPAKTLEKSINTVMIFYHPSMVTKDVIVSINATFAETTTPNKPHKIEDLQSISFNTFSELPLAGWRHNLQNPPGIQIYTEAYFTEKDTNDILDSGIGKYVTQGIIYYYQDELPDEGLMAEVHVTYGYPPLGVPYEDMQIISASVPEGPLREIYVDGLTQAPPFKLWYVDDKGIYREMIADYDIRTVEVHYNQTTIPDDGTMVVIRAKYFPDPTGYGSEDEWESFSCKSDFYLLSVEFEGLDIQTIKYETESQGILDSLSVPTKVSNVLVHFTGYPTSQDKILVKFKPTYIISLKEIEYSVRQDYAISSVSVSGVTPESVWIEGEFDGLHNINYGGISTYRKQRANKILVRFYDQDLSTDEGELISVTVDADQLVDPIAHAFLPNGQWRSPSGTDEQFRIDMSGVSVNRIEVVGDTDTPEPIRVLDKGYERPFVQGTEYQPSTLIFTYSSISQLKMYFDTQNPISYHPRHNTLFDDSTFWRAEATSKDDWLEYSGMTIFMSQLIIDLHDNSQVPASIDARIVFEDGKFLSKTYAPKVTNIDASSNYVIGDTEIKVDSTTGMDEMTLLKIGAQFQRIERVLDSQRLQITALEAPVSAGAEVRVSGVDYGLGQSVSRILIRLSKQNIHGSTIIREVRARLVREFYERNRARHVVFNDTSYWSCEGLDTPSSTASLSLSYDRPRYANRLEFEEEIESDFKVKYLDALTGSEQELYLSRNEDKKYYFYTDPEKVDDPRYEPKSIKFSSITLEWETLPKNPATGLYQTKVIKCFPQFVYDALNSSPKYMLDGDLHTMWSSTDTSSVSGIREFVADLGNVFTVNRLGIVSQDWNVSANVYYSLGDATIGYQPWGSISNIVAPQAQDIFTQSMLNGAGVGQANPDRVYVADTSRFVVGYPVNVRDDSHSIGEFYNIASKTATYLQLQVDLHYDYTSAYNGLVEQSNILLPGWYSPIVTNVNVPGDHVRGPRPHDYTMAFAMPEVMGRYFKFRFTNLPIVYNGGLRAVRIADLDIFRIFLG